VWGAFNSPLFTPYKHCTLPHLFTFTIVADSSSFFLPKFLLPFHPLSISYFSSLK
jgi:hypothetical protein